MGVGRYGVEYGARGMRQCSEKPREKDSPKNRVNGERGQTMTHERL